LKGKILIVEDEPIVALDLQQEVEQFGCEVVGLAESADEALIAVEANRPDLALMDVRIVGSMDGIQTARLLRNMYQVPVIFLTSYSDELTISRAAREMPYGYLTKPFQSRELKAALRVGLHRAMMDAGQHSAREAMEATVGGMREGVLTVTPDHEVRFMNAAAERLTGWALAAAKGRKLYEVLDLSDGWGRPLPELNNLENAGAFEEFGWSLKQPEGGASVLVDLSVAPLAAQNGERTGFVVTLRDAGERLRAQAIEETLDEARSFDRAPMAIVQLDEDGRVVRVNQALLRESGVAAESLVGRSLTGLSMDADPRISHDLMYKLLQGSTSVATARARVIN
jgi:PAS domain S-box-containing protein